MVKLFQHNTFIKPIAVDSVPYTLKQIEEYFFTLYNSGIPDSGIGITGKKA